MGKFRLEEIYLDGGYCCIISEEVAREGLPGIIGLKRDTNSGL
jgi:hypothetical protein